MTTKRKEPMPVFWESPKASKMGKSLALKFQELVMLLVIVGAFIAYAYLTGH